MHPGNGVYILYTKSVTLASIEYTKTTTKGNNMSTSFKVKTHIGVLSETDIAFRFSRCGPNPESEVRFAFPRELIGHVSDVVVWGSDGSRTTIGELLDKAVFVDFLQPEQAADTFLCWGSDVKQNGKKQTA